LASVIVNWATGDLHVRMNVRVVQSALVLVTGSVMILEYVHAIQVMVVLLAKSDSVLMIVTVTEIVQMEHVYALMDGVEYIAPEVMLLTFQKHMES